MQMVTNNDDKSQFLAGDATAGHHQIELACDSCHQEAFGGDLALQDACLNCHKAELTAADDSHPAKKFNDPRNADRLETVNAQLCITCHKEHQAEQTLPMGLTLAKDYCLFCHEDIEAERETHANLTFDTCASAGCHNYHDNRALYEDFLIEHGQAPWLSEQPLRPTSNHSVPDSLTQSVTESLKLHFTNPAYSATISKYKNDHPDISQVFSNSAHSQAAMDCHSCHSSPTEMWLTQPDTEQCGHCHTYESERFRAGKHGMRLAQGLTALTPDTGRLSFHTDANAKTQTCGACHDVHGVDKKTAAVEGCLNCHNDQHSMAYLDSPHALTLSLKDPRQQVTCATCHLPTVKTGPDQWQIDHNQNENLRPNEKMIRSVCQDCHGLAFIIDALADRDLINSNFTGQPAQHIPSVDWALYRLTETQQSTSDTKAKTSILQKQTQQ